MKSSIQSLPFEWLVLFSFFCFHNVGLENTMAQSNNAHVIPAIHHDQTNNYFYDHEAAAQASRAEQVLTPSRRDNHRRSHNASQFAVRFVQDDDQRDLSSGSDISEFNGDNKTDADGKRPQASDYDPKWVRRSIHQVRIDIRETKQESPSDRSAEVNYGFGDWTQFYARGKTYAWLAPDIYYQPLYFEDVALERYGQTFGPRRQTLRSGAHFFRAAILWPHQMLHDHPCSYDSPFGFCRPGSTTHLVYQRHYFGRPW